MIWFGGLVLTILGFIFGRIFSQSEAILADKRRVYEEFLRNCPDPNEAYEDDTPASVALRIERLKATKGPLIMYASPTVVLALGHYLQLFEHASGELNSSSAALHPTFKTLAKAQNDLILEMRRDGFAWSAFGYHGRSRLPIDVLEKAKANALE
jgi:hypothetical protein